MRVQRELRARDFNGRFNRACLIRPNRYRYYTVLLNTVIIVLFDTFDESNPSSSTISD